MTHQRTTNDEIQVGRVHGPHEKAAIVLSLFDAGVSCVTALPAGTWGHTYGIVRRR